MSKTRLGIVVILAILVAIVPGLAAADEEVRLTPEGYCVLVSPADPPYIFVDPSRCNIPPGG
jgi:hypothetical protein